MATAEMATKSQKCCRRFGRLQLPFSATTIGKNYSIRFKIWNNKLTIRFEMKNHYSHSTKCNPLKDMMMRIDADVFALCSIEGDIVPKDGDEVTFKRCLMPPKNEKYAAVHVHIAHQAPVAHEKWDKDAIERPVCSASDFQ